MGRIKFFFFLSLLILLFFREDSLCQPEISGYLKFMSYINILGENKYLFERNGTRLQLNFSSHAGNTSIHSTFNIDAYKGMEGKVSLNPVEFYIDYNAKQLKLRIGRQFIFWGKNEWSSPTDVIIPWDYENISSEIEDYRIPLTMIQGIAEFKGIKFQAVINPLFSPNKISLKSTPSIKFENEVLPEKKLSNSEFGVKLFSNIQGWDFSFSFWNGFDKYPSLFFSFDPAQHILKATPVYKRLRMLGFDFEKIWGSHGLKAELSYNQTEDRKGTNIFIKNPHMKYLLGAEWLPTEKLNFQIQYIREEILKLNPELESMEWMRIGAPPRIPEKITDYGLLILRWNPGDFTSFQIVNVRNLKSKDLLGLLLANYEIQDSLKIVGGFVIFEGKKGTTFGNLKDSSRFFIELKYSF
ncbi:MAG: DUF1302 family protein [Candidatus Aminicenantia bacterium]